MGTWREQYVNRCEDGFYDQHGVPEVTIPKGMQVFWLHDASNPAELNRPEMDAKDRQAGHPEVYEGRFSANGFYLSCTGTYWLVTNRIYVQCGRAVRGSAMYMHVFANANGGARLGLVDGDGVFVGSNARDPMERGTIEGSVVWGGWQGTYGAEALPDRKWVRLDAPEIIPTEGFVRLVVQFNVDDPGFGAGHYDVFRLEQYAEGEQPGPSPEVQRVEVTGPDGGPIVVRIESP